MKFKVGDRVAVYYPRCPIRNHAEITEVYPDGSLLVKYDYDLTYRFAAHPKQCRRLVKKERRKIWIAQSELTPAYTSIKAVWIQRDPKDLTCAEGDQLIEFVEVKKK